MISYDRLCAEQGALWHIGIHPRTTTFRWPGIVITNEKGERLPVCIRHLPYANLRQVGREILALFKGKAVELTSRIEHSVRDDMVEFEVRFQLRFIKSISGLAHLLRIEIPIPGS